MSLFANFFFLSMRDIVADEKFWQAPHIHTSRIYEVNHSVHNKSSDYCRFYYYYFYSSLWLMIFNSSFVMFYYVTFVLVNGLIWVFSCLSVPLTYETFHTLCSLIVDEMVCVLILILFKNIHGQVFNFLFKKSSNTNLFIP